MINRLYNWFDTRTGVQGFVHATLYEHVPGGARWRYVWGSTLVFAFAVQVITGFFLWMSYSPSAQTAWESVYYIQNQMWGGAWLRGIHHFMSQAMIVLMALHLMQVVIDGAYRAPREVNFWIGLILMQVVLGLSLTGYLLPWDQKGYWATNVATKILVTVPVVGPALQRLVVGGTDYGHHTLTRFFALHAGLLPMLMIGFIALHVYLFRKHGLKYKEPKKGPDTTFWPDQVLKDTIACLAVLVTILFLIAYPKMMGRGYFGAELGAPADPSVSYSAARPEWYFLFLFQFLKAFPGHKEVYGAIVIPGAVMLLLFLMPLTGKVKVGHWFNVLVIFLLLGGIAYLTGMAVKEDRGKPEYKAAVARANEEAERAVELAEIEGIPPTGAVGLLRHDPKIQGPRLFAQYCASCHRYDGHNGLGMVEEVKPGPTTAGSDKEGASADSKAESAADLKGYGSRAWLLGFFDPKQVDTRHYFGGTKFKNGKMVKQVKKLGGFEGKSKDALTKAVIALSAEAHLKSQREQDAKDAAMIAQGRELIKGDELDCTSCHKFREPNEDASGPDLSGYASRDWLVAFISNPGHERFYGERNDRMPAFGAKKMLDEEAIGMIADWLRGEWAVKGESFGEPARVPSTQGTAEK
jgi:ubiquinol-cytochrome c reductase cytochrome b subunit